LASKVGKVYFGKINTLIGSKFLRKGKAPFNRYLDFKGLLITRKGLSSSKEGRKKGPKLGFLGA